MSLRLNLGSGQSLEFYVQGWRWFPFFLVLSPATILAVEVFQFMTVRAQQVNILSFIVASVSVLVMNLQDERLHAPLATFTLFDGEPQASTGAVWILALMRAVLVALVVWIIPTARKDMPIRIGQKLQNRFSLVLLSPEGIQVSSFDVAFVGAEANSISVLRGLANSCSRHPELQLARLADNNPTFFSLRSVRRIATVRAERERSLGVRQSLVWDFKGVAALNTLKPHFPHS